ncbi:hypothetical protein C3L33_11429, partial [Rhododendron williamsianum]
KLDLNEDSELRIVPEPPPEELELPLEEEDEVVQNPDAHANPADPAEPMSDAAPDAQECLAVLFIIGTLASRAAFHSFEEAAIYERYKQWMTRCGCLYKSYSSGVFTGQLGTDLDHGATAVGYGTATSGTKYWLVENSCGSINLAGVTKGT